MKIKAAAALLGTVFLWALMAVVTRNVVSLVSASYLLFLRMFVAGVFFLPIFLQSRPWKKPQFKKLVIVSFGSAFNITFFMFGIQFTSASVSQLVYAALPILILVINGVVLHEKYPKNKIMGVFAGFAGLLFIMYRSSIEKGTTITGSLFGNMLVVFAMFSWTFYLLSSKKISKYFTPLEIGSTSILVGFLLASVIFILNAFFFPIKLYLDMRIAFSALYIGFCGTFLTYILYQYAVKHLSSLSVSLANYIQPITTTFLAVIFIGERLTIHYLVGSLLVFIGIFFTTGRNILKKNR